MPTGNQQENFKALFEALADIKEDSTVTPEQWKELVQNIITMLAGANQPDEGSVKKFLQTYYAFSQTGGGISEREQAILDAQLDAILSSANIPPEEFDAVVASVKEILDAANIDETEKQAVVDAVKAIITTAQENQQENARR